MGGNKKHKGRKQNVAGNKKTEQVTQQTT